MALLNKISSETQDWIKSLDYISLDTETISLDDLTLVGFSFAGLKDGEVVGYYVPLKHSGYNISLGQSKTDNMPFQDAYELLKLIMVVDNVIFHNYSFDSRVLSGYGLKVKYPPHDTLILSQLLDENISHRLKSLVPRYLGYKMLQYKDVCNLNGKMVSFKNVNPELGSKYGVDDAIWTYKLFDYLYSRIKRDEKLFKLYSEIERPLIEVVRDMEINGIKADVKKVDEIKSICNDKRVVLKKKIEDEIGYKINIDSSAQLKTYFIDKLHAPIIKVSELSQNPSIDKEVLQQYAETFPVAGWILDYRKYSKLLSTFIPALTPKKQDMIYPLFNQSATISGRFSSSRPNMQNIPREDEFGIRDIILPDEGQVLLDADYSQIELRILAHFSKDSVLIKAYKEGRDIHQTTADACHCDRQTAKTINFGLMYRMSSKTLAKRLKIDKKEADAYLTSYFELYNSIEGFYKQVINEARQNGFIRTLYGRKRRLTEQYYRRSRGEKYHEMTSIINSKIQGCLSGDTLVWVEKEGLKSMKSLVNQKVKLWDGDKFSLGQIVKSGLKESVLVKCHGGYEINCSPNHKFLTVNVTGRRVWKTPSEFSSQERIILSKGIPDKGGPLVIKRAKTIPHWKAPNGVWNAQDLSIMDINNNFDIGIVLGRIASDGSVRKNHGVLLYIAEHEFDIVPQMEQILRGVKNDLKVKLINREKFNRKPMKKIVVGSAVLARQLEFIGLKKKVPKEVLRNKECLRGYLKGFFDGDGGISGDKIILTFGRGKSEWAKQVQQALLVFGIRSRLNHYPKGTYPNQVCSKVVIMKRDSLLFMEEIGFLSSRKKELGKSLDCGKVTGSKLYGRAVSVKEVLFKNKKIEMFDFINSKTGRFSANGLIVHNSSADIMKYSMIKMFEPLKLFGARILLTVHDEVVVSVPKENVLPCCKIIEKTMIDVAKLSIPVEVDVRIGKNWGEAKHGLTPAEYEKELKS